MMPAYYNEFDPKTAAWLRELIKQGLIADGAVDDRSILDVSADDLIGFTQCHFFAGIGGWSYALRLAGWSDDQEVWTGSPPCQPFSSAGARKGQEDERHLAPHFASLIAERRPPILFGEQVASAAVFGKIAKKARSQSEDTPEWSWIDDLSDRLEAAHYAVAASDIPAASVGAPHIRQRTFFGAVRLADAEFVLGRREASPADNERDAKANGPTDRPSGRGSPLSRLGDTEFAGLEGHGGNVDGSDEPGRVEAGSGGSAAATSNAPDGMGSERPRADHGGWDNADWLFCRDGKWRPVESGTFPLASRLPARVVRLRGYGNAIVPQAAALFINSFLDSI
jgi:DNA (cytosine-5)-methyltransferase 1